MSEAPISQPPPANASSVPSFVVPAAFPVVTYALIAINVLVFLATVATGASFVQPSAESLLPWGADFAPLTTNGQWWRIVTCCFLHFGIIHLGMNMYVLFQAGPFTERLFGRLRYIVLYMLAGVGGSLVSLWIHPYAVGAGASGAIFGVYGGLLAFLLTHRSVIPAQSLRQIAQSALIFLGYNFIYGLSSRTIDLSAHIGGLVTGFLAGLLLARRNSALLRPSQLTREG